MAYVSRIDSADFEPFPRPDDPTLSAGEIAWIVPGEVAFWRADEGTMSVVAPYPFVRSEVVHVIEGAVRITTEDGDEAVLNTGDVGVFDAGIQSMWEFTFPFAKLSVLPIRSRTSSSN